MASAAIRRRKMEAAVAAAGEVLAVVVCGLARRVLCGGLRAVVPTSREIKSNFDLFF